MSNAQIVATRIEATEVAPVVVQSETAAILSMIERLAVNPAADIDKIMKLMEMRERIQMKQAETAFNAAMAAAQAELQPVVKRLKNDHTKANYADLDAIYEMAKPIITSHGFGPSFGTGKAEIAGHVRIVCDLTHAEGFSKRYEQEFPLDNAGTGGKTNKTDIQAIGSTMTYGRRYMTLGMFDIATKNDTDGNKRAPAPGPTITPEQAETIREIVDSLDGSPERFCAHFKIKSVGELPAAKFADAMAAIKRRQEAA
jgi:hypothetical protein